MVKVGKEVTLLFGLSSLLCKSTILHLPTLSIPSTINLASDSTRSMGYNCEF